MAKVKLKINGTEMDAEVEDEREPKRVNKRAPGYVKPDRAIGCAAFAHLTYADARSLVLQRFEIDYIRELHAECAGNVSEMARRADIERAYVRQHQKAAGLR